MKKNASLQSTFAARWVRVEKSVKWAFFACLIAGLLIHLFAFTNIIPNSDGISRVNDPQQMTISGRWFLHYASWFNAYTQMPMLIGVLSLLFLGLSAALTADLLQVRSVFAGAMIGILMAAVPALAYTYLYMFTASAYCFAILLATLSVWLTERYKYGFLWSAVILALAVGIYQTYITVAISLCLLVLVRFAPAKLDKPKEILFAGLKKLVFLALGMGLYYGILQIFLHVKDLTLLSYLGMNDTVSHYPVGRLPSVILATYAQVFRQFFVPHGFVGIAVIAADVLLAGLSLFALISRLAAARKKKVWSIVMIAAILLLLPLGINFTQVLSPSSTPTPIMQYSFVYPLILSVAFLPELGKKKLGKVCTVLGVCAALLLTLKYAQVDNLCYTASAQAHRATESFATRLAARIEQTEGYEAGMEVAIIGGYPDEYYTSQIEAFEAVKHYSCLPTTVTPLNKQIYYYLNDWLNIPIAEPEEQTLIAVAKTAEFQAMPLYPSDGCVQLIDGRIVVKLADTYTPKQQYEIDYENRR